MADSRIDGIFESLRKSGRKAVIPFICGGSPIPSLSRPASTSNLSAESQAAAAGEIGEEKLPAGSTGRLLEVLDAAGAPIIEVGIPFSDPIADGPVIAAAMHTAITAGSTPRAVFEQVASVRGRIKAGLVAMISMSLVHRAGGGRPVSVAQAFIGAAKDAGFDGVIVPDAPIEVAGELVAAARAAGISYIQLISPTTAPSRVTQIVEQCSGFVYAMARVGITGTQSTLPNIAPLVARIRAVTHLPIAVGFGISTADHVKAVHAHADAAIIGSALVKRLLMVAAEGGDVEQAARNFMAEVQAE